MNLFTFRELRNFFPAVPEKTLLYYVRHGYIPFTDSKKDGRGLHRLFSEADVAKAKSFLQEREEARVRHLLGVKP